MLHFAKWGCFLDVLFVLLLSSVFKEEKMMKTEKLMVKLGRGKKLLVSEIFYATPVFEPFSTLKT